MFVRGASKTHRYEKRFFGFFFLEKNQFFIVFNFCPLKNYLKSYILRNNHQNHIIKNECIKQWN